MASSVHINSSFWTDPSTQFFLPKPYLSPSPSHQKKQGKSLGYHPAIILTYLNAPSHGFGPYYCSWQCLNTAQGLTQCRSHFQAACGMQSLCFQKEECLSIWMQAVSSQLVSRTANECWPLFFRLFLLRNIQKGRILAANNNLGSRCGVLTFKSLLQFLIMCLQLQLSRLPVDCIPFLKWK